MKPPPELAQRVASVPYDTVNSEEAAALAAGNPDSFLRIVRPEIDLPGHAAAYSDQVYELALRNFEEFQRKGILVPSDDDSLHVYRLTAGDHSQSALVTCCHIEDYETNVIRRHERTREEKENERTRLIETLNANTGPVFLAYRDRADIDGAIASIETQEPFASFTAVDGVEHTVWRAGPGTELVEAFRDVPACYIADGHHRAAGAARVGATRREANPAHTGEEEYNWFLAALFPAGQLRVLPYNRVVADLHGIDTAAFIGAAGKVFDMEAGVPASPPAPGQISMYAGDKWYGLRWDAEEEADPVAGLDVSVLQDKLLGPVLGIGDPRTDKRIDFVGGSRGTAALEALVDSGEATVAFSVHPVTVDQMMAVADAGRIMPPKSTWFDPKLRSGLFVHTF